MSALDRISLTGFKSIEKLDSLKLGSLNVLIGANGSGKSNLVDLFRVLKAMVEKRFQGYVLTNGPADGYFFNGVSHTKKIEVSLWFGLNSYSFRLEPSATGQIIIAEEHTGFSAGSPRLISSGVLESTLPDRKKEAGIWTPKGKNYYVWESVSSWQVYHFHDTSLTAGMRREVGVNQSKGLRADASNLAAFLLGLRENHPAHFDALRKTLKRVAPYFEDFDLRVVKADPEDMVRLMWRRIGTDYVFSPGHFSDGTIRFLCLATVLTQPDPPTTIVLDEPELGLHPEALSVLAGLIRSASSRMQIVLATQSPVLLSEFSPEQIITVDQVNGATTFNRVDQAGLDEWLDEYTLGELWQKGNIRGGVNNA